MTIQNLRGDLLKRRFKPLYLLHGEEPFYLDKAEALFDELVLTEAEKSFNHTILYGRDCDAQTITDAALRYPMFAEHQLIVVREAQQLRDLDKLQSYAEKPVPTTVLVLVYKYKKLPANRRLYKAIAQHGIVFESKKIRDYEVASWVQGHVSESGYKIQPAAAQLMEQYLGSDLSRIDGELRKLMINLEPGSTITPAHVERFIGISREYNVFELQNALLKNDTARVWKIAENLRANIRQHPLVMIVGSLYNFFSKVYAVHFIGQTNDKELAQVLGVHPFFVKDYRSAASAWPIPRLERGFAQLLQYDLRSKGVDDAGTESGELLRELIWKLLR